MATYLFWTPASPECNTTNGLDVTVYPKPTYTDQYLDFRSHHPIHLKRGLVRCVYYRGNSVTTFRSNLQTKQLHLSSVLRQNWYPSSFKRSAAHPLAPHDPLGDEEDSQPIVSIPYVAGMSEEIKRICRGSNLRVIFWSGHMLRSLLTQVKDTLPQDKQSWVM